MFVGKCDVRTAKLGVHAIVRAVNSPVNCALQACLIHHPADHSHASFAGVFPEYGCTNAAFIFEDLNGADLCTASIERRIINRNFSRRLW